MEVVNLNENDLESRIGTPRLKRVTRSRTVELNKELEEVQFQITVIIPTDHRGFNDDLFRLFEDRAAATVRNVHVEMAQLELVGGYAGFTVPMCASKYNRYNEWHSIFIR